MADWTSWAGEENRTTVYGGDPSFNVLGRSFNQSGITFNASISFEERYEVWTEIEGPED